jgi:hypothetical protein
MVGTFRPPGLAIMANESSPTEREAALMARITALEAAAKVSEKEPSSGNLVDQLWRYVRAFIPLPILLGAIAIFIGFHGWEWYFSAQLSTVETRLKEATAELKKVQADAAASPGEDGEPLQVETFLAELTKKQAEASRAQTEAAAQNTLVDNETQRLQSIKAEVANKQAQAAKARAAANAAREREGLLTLEDKAARVKLMQTEIEAISNMAGSSASMMIQRGGPARLREIICGNKYAELFGCPDSYVRRYKSAEAPASEEPTRSVAVSSPSFDCTKARRPDEQTVCNSAELSRLDRQMADAFVQAGGRGNSRLAAIQRRYISSRRECGSDASCIHDLTVLAINAYRR